MHILLLVTDNNPSSMIHSGEGRRMNIEMISWSLSKKVWDRAEIKLVTPGSAVRHPSVARHVTDCATRPSILKVHLDEMFREYKRVKIYGKFQSGSGNLILLYMIIIYFSIKPLIRPLFFLSLRCCLLLPLLNIFKKCCARSLSSLFTTSWRSLMALWKYYFVSVLYLFI